MFIEHHIFVQISDLKVQTSSTSHSIAELRRIDSMKRCHTTTTITKKYLLNGINYTLYLIY